MNSIYSQIITAKNGTPIPVFTSGKTMESRYNPERDAQNLLDTITIENDAPGFFLVTGIGSGLFINLLSNKYPQAKIVALENSDIDIDFLSELESVNKARQNQNIIFATIENLFDTLIQNYLPARYGTFKVIEQKPWLLENQKQASVINETVNRAIGIVSADYSVQAHFGKLWLKNILENAALCENISFDFPYPSKEELCKTAVVAAAGPSLEEFLEQNKNHFEDYYFIATDTAFSTLSKYGITPELCVSIDGQNVSYNHFLGDTNRKTSFCFDLCANSSAAKMLCDSGSPVFFFCSGHPLAAAINNFGKHFLPVLFSGSGTVTITAVDLSLKLGFKNLIVPGADFSYPDGKTYSRGTYLESLYNKSSNKIKPSEHTFCTLMYRTPLTELSENRKTNQILNAYKTSFETYLLQNQVSFKTENGVYKLISTGTNTQVHFSSEPSFSLKAFLKYFSESKISDVEVLLLPYIAWLKKSDNYSNANYEELVKLAFNTIVSYNI